VPQETAERELADGVFGAGYNCMTSVAELPPRLAVIVSLCAEVTPENTALNPALLAPAKTIAVGVTARAELLLMREMTVFFVTGELK
jgi:hypothetical protein